jgi:hypothetical protein
LLFLLRIFVVAVGLILVVLLLLQSRLKKYHAVMQLVWLLGLWRCREEICISSSSSSSRRSSTVDLLMIMELQDQEQED